MIPWGLSTEDPVHFAAAAQTSTGQFGVRCSVETAHGLIHPPGTAQPADRYCNRSNPGDKPPDGNDASCKAAAFKWFVHQVTPDLGYPPLPETLSSQPDSRKFHFRNPELRRPQRRSLEAADGGRAAFWVDG